MSKKLGKLYPVSNLAIKTTRILKKCPICNKKKFKYFSHILEILECTACGHRFVKKAKVFKGNLHLFDIPTKAEIKKSVSDFEKSAKPDLDFLKINPLVKKLWGKKILDLACGQGFYLNYFKKQGWPKNNLYGLDLCKSAITYGKKVFGIKNLKIADFSKKLPCKTKKFDIILMFETIEHSINPLKILLNIGKYLKDDGIVILRHIPNSKSFESQIAGEYWFQYRIDEHFHFFNLKSLEQLFKKAGFKIIDQYSYSEKPFIFYDLKRIARNIGLYNKEELQNIPKKVLWQTIRTEFENIRKNKQVNKLLPQITEKKLISFYNNYVLNSKELGPDLNLIIIKK